MVSTACDDPHVLHSQFVAKDRLQNDRKGLGGLVVQIDDVRSGNGLVHFSVPFYRVADMEGGSIPVDVRIPEILRDTDTTRFVLLSRH